MRTLFDCILAVVAMLRSHSEMVLALTDACLGAAETLIAGDGTSLRRLNEAGAAEGILHPFSSLTYLRETLKI